MRRQDLVTVYYDNGMHRSVKKHRPAPSPYMSGLIHNMNVIGHATVEDGR